MTQNKLTPSERVWGPANLGKMRGFLPLQGPSILSDSAFSHLNQLLAEMPVIKKDKSTGLLGRNQFRSASDTLADHSPLLHQWIEALEGSSDESEKNALAHALATAFRDYQYLKMGYLFEPVLHGAQQACSRLPSRIANPLVLLAKTFEQKPWLEYASGYVLMNSHFCGAIEADKIDLIRQWHGGPDEYFFQTIHSIIEWETPRLFASIQQIIDSVTKKKPEALPLAMSEGINTTKIMLDRLKLMPKLSRPAYYAADVRPQIQGLVGNCGEGNLFPNTGVLFESEYLSSGNAEYINNIRGQTGAQSSIIPLLDNILGITNFYAKGTNALTQMLREFRFYRPKPHTQLLEQVEATQQRLQIREYLKKHVPLQLSQWTGLICQFREFHFFLAMAYIVKPGKSAPSSQSRAIGTGGSPTPKYLPQHVNESLEALKDALAHAMDREKTGKERAIYDYWQSYVKKTGMANQQRSQTVEDYLNQAVGTDQLNESIQMTEQKIVEDSAEMS